MMIASAQAANPTWNFPFSPTEWAQTPGAVQVHLLALHTQLQDLQQQQQQLQIQVDRLQGRLPQTSTTSSKPPSSDSPFKKRTRRSSSGKRGAKKGHAGSGPILLSATEVHAVYPAPCAGGRGGLMMARPYYTHQVIAWPPIEMQVTHFELHQGPCPGCGQLRKAGGPSGSQTGYGPRLSALIGELSGMQGTSRRLIHDFCQAVLHMPMSLGAVHKVIDRVSEARLPHYEPMAERARQAPVGSIDETPWYCQNMLQWLWTMAPATVT